MQHQTGLTGSDSTKDMNAAGSYGQKHRGSLHLQIAGYLYRITGDRGGERDPSGQGEPLSWSLPATCGYAHIHYIKKEVRTR